MTPPTAIVVRSLLSKCLTSAVALPSSFIKVVVKAASPADSVVVAAAHQSFSSQSTVKSICVAAGEEGKLSRLLNRFFSPVTHPDLHTKAAPGQLSVVEIKSLRRSVGI